MVAECLKQSREEYQKRPLQWVNKLPDGNELDLRDESQIETNDDGSVSYDDRLDFIDKALQTRLVQSQT